MTRFGATLAIAIGLHGCLIVFCSLQQPRRSQSLFHDDRVELQIELAPAEPAVVLDRQETRTADEAVEPSQSKPVVATSRQLATAARTPAIASAAAGEERLALGNQESGSATESSTAMASAAAGALSTTPSGEAAARVDPKIDLGLDGRLFRLGPQDQATPLRKRRANGSELSEQLNRSLVDNSEMKRAQAKGNILIGALNAAVRQSGAPDHGNALIRVTFNASGELSGVELLRGAVNDWAAAIQAFRAQTKGRRVELPNGARGLRVTYDVSTKLQLASGRAVGRGPIGVKRPTLGADGLTLQGGFDLTDFANKITRLASSRVVVEEVL